MFEYVFVGVSLQNKGLDTNDYSAIVEQASREFGFRKLVFLVADEIELINQRVFSKGSERKHRRDVEKMASEIEAQIEMGCTGREWSEGRIITCRWLDILDSGYWDNYFEVQRLFIHNPHFANDVRYAIEEYARRRARFFSNADTLYLCNYVLQEIPTLLYGITLDRSQHGGSQTQYGSMIYPAPPNARIDKICEKIVNEVYGMTFFKPPYCKISKYEIPST